MIGKTPRGSALFDVGNVFDLELPADSFYAQLAQAEELVREVDFAGLYCEDNGRPSIPPAQMVLLMILQYHERLSDREAVEHSAYDLRWAAVLHRPAGKRLCARSTLVEFRARLALRDGVDRVFDRVLERAREQGLLPTRPLRVLLDTRAVLGRGAVEDTYNLLARAIDLLLEVLARGAQLSKAEWAAQHELEAYVRRRDASLKGHAKVDWDDPSSRRRFLRQVVTDARRLLVLAREALPGLEPQQQQEACEQVALLEQILRQDVEETPGPGSSGGGVELREGTSRDRVPSATDPEQRHGHKSQNRHFTGHKARIAVDAASQLIVDAEVLAGNAPDAAGAVAQTQRVVERCGEVAEVVGDCAFAAGSVRAEFQEAGHSLRARQPRAGAPAWGISKSAFLLVFAGDQVVGVRCPAGHESRAYGERKDGSRVFTFRKWCARCPLRHKCVQAKHLKQGRTVQVHPQERLLQAARAYQATPEGKETLRSRVGAEHALARLARLGLGQARYFGRAKTRVQIVLTCATANLRRLLRWEAAQAAALR
jgi:transposase